MTLTYKLSYCKKGGSHTIQADANTTPEFQKMPVHENNSGRYHGSAMPTTVRAGVRSYCMGSHATRLEFANMHLWLGSLFGSLTSTPTSAHDSHAIQWSKTKQPLEAKELINSDVRKYNDVLVDSMTISGDSEGDIFPEVAMNLLGLTRTDDSTFTEELTFSNDKHGCGIYSDIKWQADFGAGYIDFSECIKNFTIEITNNLTPSWCFNGESTPERFKTALFGVSFTFNLEYSDETFRDLFENATVFAIKFTCENTTEEIETGVYPKIIIEVLENYINEHSKEVVLLDTHLQTIKTIALGDTNTPANCFLCTVINEVA